MAYGEGYEMKELLDIYRMTEISVEVRCRLIIQVGQLINHQYASNVTEPLVHELLMLLDPQHFLLKDAQEKPELELDAAKSLPRTLSMHEMEWREKCSGLTVELDEAKAEIELTAKNLRAKLVRTQAVMTETQTILCAEDEDPIEDGFLDITEKALQHLQAGINEIKEALAEAEKLKAGNS